MSKIAFLIKSEVRNIDYNCTAGAERILINDYNSMQKKNDIKIFANCTFKNFPASIKRKKIYYPHKLIDLLRNKSANKTWNSILKRVFQISEFTYTIQFLLITINYDLYYVLDVPLVGIFSPKKTYILNQNYSSYKFILSRLLNKKYQKLNYLFCSKYLKNRVEKFLHGELINSIIISNSVKFFKEKRIIRYKKNDVIKLGFIGQWNYVKGLEKYIETIKILSNNSSKYKFYIAGSTNIWSLSSQDLANLENLNKQVDYLCKQKLLINKGELDYSDLKNYYQHIDYLVFPSIWDEPFGNVIIESMAYGTPVIAFKSGATTEIITNKYNGFIVNKKNTYDLIKTITTVYSSINPNQYKKISTNCISTIKDNYMDTKRYSKLNKMLNYK